MKRGFLKQKGPMGRSSETPTRSTVTKTPDLGTAETHKTIQGITFMSYDPRITQYPDAACVLASVPLKNTSAVPLSANERTECTLRGGSAVKIVFSSPKSPLPMPKPKGPNYEIISTTNMGLGMFASRDIKRGDLIFAERPLILIPASPFPSLEVVLSPDFHFDWEEFIQPSFERLTPENQAAYRALANSHTKDGSGPLLGVLRTNAFGIQLGEGVINRYKAVYKELSRINHSCRPNAINKFALPTFSVQVRAMLDIKKGDEIFISYLSLPSPTPERQATLVPYGFQCNCASCTTPGFDDLYQKVLDRVMHLSNSFNDWVRDRSLPADHLIKPALALIPVMEANGLYCVNIYEINMVTLMKCYSALGDLTNAAKYGNLCGLWHLIREGNSEMYEGLKNLQLHTMQPEWRARV